MIWLFFVDPVLGLTFLFSFLFSFTLHEAAHALAATLLSRAA
jgi:vacuolar-type H+-ATPase subunit I/STV1